MTRLLPLLLATGALAWSLMVLSGCSSESAVRPQVSYDGRQGTSGPSDPAAPPASPDLLLEEWLRDTYVFAASDGWYYLTGTLPDSSTGHAWATNPGVPLWRSRDLETWEDLGLVWSFERDGTWDAEVKPVARDHWEYDRKDFGTGEPVAPIRRAAWAPEIHEVHGDYYLTFSLNWIPGYGTVLLRSTSGRPEGPYAHVADGLITQDIDSSLFVDDDGTVYFLWLDGQYAPLKDDMSGLAEEPRRLRQTSYVPEPYLEGAYLFKANDRYHLSLAAWSYRHLETGELTYRPDPDAPDEWVVWDYDSIVAASDRLEGPYGERYTAVAGGGHNNFFQDRQGQWWSTYFGNPRGDNPDRPFIQRPGLVPTRWTAEGRIVASPSAARTP